MAQRRWTATILVLVLSLGACALSRADAWPYATKQWTTDDGLPGNAVLAIAQTRDGYLWLGTLNGLARFDGAHFTRFDEDTTPELRSSRIVKLFTDRRDNLWVGTEPGGIYLVSPQGKVQNVSLKPKPEAPTGRLRDICEDAKGRIWVYTDNGYLGRYQDGQMRIMDNKLPPSRCRSLASDGSGQIWVGTDQSFQSASRAKSPSQAHAAQLDYLLGSKEGGFWVFADGSIQKWSSNGLEKVLAPYPWTNSVQVTAACEDGEGGLVVGTYGDPTGDGVYWFDKRGREAHLDKLSNLSILCLLVDRDGSLWIGTNGGGLNRVKRQWFNVLNRSQGPLVVQSVCNDGHGGLWIGYNRQRIDHWTTNGLRQFTVARPNRNLAVQAVFVDAARNVWAGAQTRGLLPGGLFRLEDDQFKPVSAFEQIADEQVSAIYQDSQGELWVGTEGGLACWNGRDWRTFFTLDGLSANSVQAIAQGKDGALWVGTATGGLNCLRDGHVSWFFKTNGLPSNDVSALYLDDQGVLWIGTASGLAQWYQGRLKSLAGSDPLLRNSISYLLEDDRGYLWLGSNAGLLRAKKRTLNDYANGLADSVPVRSYGTADGLPSSECAQGSQPAACRTPDGRLWFPTIRGLAFLDPAHLGVNTNPPPVIIESVLIDGQLQSTNTLRAPALAGVTVPADKESLEIHFVSLNLSAPEKGYFKYRLEGHETAWTRAEGNQASAHFSKLPMGHYTFQVQACNEDGVWNTGGASLAVTVLPAFWQTWWFRTMATLAFLGLLTGLVYYVSTQKLHRQLAVLRQQEALERERSRIARDLHDQLGANLTQVALLGELAEADRHQPDEVEAHARQISETARDTTHALDEIVWTVNPANDTLDGLVNYICKYAQEYLEMAGLRYRLEVPPQLPAISISPELRHNTFLAAKEAVNNVVKHAHASAAWLRLRLEPDQFALEIADDGKGLCEGAAEKGRNGLRNMHKRMEDVGGSFFLGTSPEGGTLVRLSAPLNAFTHARLGQDHSERVRPDR